MSMRATIKTTIHDLEAFKTICESHDIVCRDGHGTQTVGGRSYEVHSELVDNQNGRVFGHLVKDGGGFLVVTDRDGNYNRTAQRLGGDCGWLTRDYATEMVQRQIYANGGQVMDQQTDNKGCVYLRVAVNG